MPSLPDQGRRLHRVSRPQRVLLGLILACAVATPAILHGQSSGRVDGRPGSPALARALDTVKADPALGAPRTERRFRWKGSDQQPATPRTMPAWLTRFALFTAESLRYVVWLGALVGAALLVSYLVRVTRETDAPAGFDTAGLRPTHVQDLDIRPESLPRDVGAAARALWLAGEHRAAVALLYRGALSRLVHGHNLPIRDASTEGDCLALCRASLAIDALGFVETLVRVRQRLVYGHETPPADTVLELCDRFAAALARSGAAESWGGAA